MGLGGGGRTVKGVVGVAGAGGGWEGEGLQPGQGVGQGGFSPLAGKSVVDPGQSGHPTLRSEEVVSHVMDGNASLVDGSGAMSVARNKTAPAL